MSEPTPLPASSGSRLPPPPSADEMRAESERIDELTRLSELRGIDDTDAQADLWDALFGLDRWWFIARGEMPDVQPMAVEVDGRPMILAFTSPARARQHADAMGLPDDEAGRLLALPSRGFVDDAAARERAGVFGVLFDAQGRGPFAPLGALVAMRSFGEQRRSRRAATEGARTAPPATPGRPTENAVPAAAAAVPAAAAAAPAGAPDSPPSTDRFARPTDPPLLVVTHDRRRARRQLVGAGLGALLAVALLAFLVFWSVTASGWLWIVVALWLLPTFLTIATTVEYVGALRHPDRPKLAVHRSAVVIDDLVVVPWDSVTRVSWVDGPAGTLAGGGGRSLRRISFLGRLFWIGDGNRMVNFHLRDHDDVERHAGSAATTRLVDPTGADPSLPKDAAHAYVGLTDAVGPREFGAVAESLRGLVVARGLGWSRAAE